MSGNTYLDDPLGYAETLGGIPLVSANNLLIVAEGELVLPCAATLRAHCISKVPSTNRCLISEQLLDNHAQPDFAQPLITQPISDHSCGFVTRRWQTLSEEIHSLPPAPKVAQQIIDIYQDPNASCDELASIVNADSALTSQVIGWANSPYYNLANTVTTAKDAIVRALGFDLVMALCLGLSLTQNYRNELSASIANRIWKESLYTAELAQQLCLTKGLNEMAALGFTAGLTHNLGSWLIAQRAPGLQVDIEAYYSANPHLPTSTIEQSTLGIDYLAVSKMLFEQWQLPDDLAQTALGASISKGELSSDNAMLFNIVTTARRAVELQGKMPIGVATVPSYNEDLSVIEKVYGCLEQGTHTH